MMEDNPLKPDHAQQKRHVAIQRMFDRIARRYDLMNRLMTFGQDRVWRQCVMHRASFPRAGRLLDIGAGTGAIASEAVAADPAASVVAADFSFEMMKAGRQNCQGGQIHWCSADALNLPFPDNAFDAVTSGYLIRNVTSAARAFTEQRRVVKPGGRVVCLDTSPPEKNLFYPLVLFQLKVVIPLLGTLVSGDRKAYTYLPDSTRAFQSPDTLAATMRSAGFVNVAYRSFMFGTISVHVGEKPEK